MALISDATGLAMLKQNGAEQFDTGKPERLWAIFDEAYLETELERFTVANREPMLQCRTIDASAHELIKESRVTRVSDGVSYTVKDFEPDGTGMTVLRLRK